MKKDFLKLASSAEDYYKRLEEIRQSEYISDQLKEENEAIEREKFINNAKTTFDGLKNRLESQAAQAKQKLDEMQAGDYEQRQYEYSKAANELQDYDSIKDFLQAKTETASNEIELQEARKLALSKARAEDAGTYEMIKNEVVKTLPEEEKKARQELAEIEIKKYNIDSAENTFNYELPEVEKGNPEMLRVSLVSFADTTDQASKIENKIADTIK